MDCKTCKEMRKALPFSVHESDMARMCLVIHRLILGWIVTVLLLAGSWAWFLHYEAQFEDVVTNTQENFESSADGGGVAIANGSGAVNYGG